MFATFLDRTFVIVLLITAIPLVSGSLVSLLVAVLQAATQIQEQSISFLVKLFSVAAVIYLLGEKFFYELITFFTEILATLEYFGRM